jgi:hypothetical protein
VSGASLLDARLALHHAAQLVAAVGASLLPAEPDDSHPNLGWDAARGALVGHPVRGARGALVFGVPSLEVIDAEGAPLAQRTLEGSSFEEALGWLSATLSEQGIDLPEKGLEPPGYELPAHGVAEGERFRFANAACEELARWFANASDSLAAFAAGTPGATPLRCWPHHFDLAFLSVRESDDAGALTKSIGCGLSPGDELVPEPYFYVSPWPYPAADAVAGLPVGCWHTGDFTAAILTAAELLDGAEATQEDRVGEFLGAAYRAGERALSL